jgi:adhesin transport system outer membrane protein
LGKPVTGNSVVWGLNRNAARYWCGRARASLAVVLFIFLFLPTNPGHAMTLLEAIKIALEANPEIGQAIANREAIEFELRQARGLYMPSLDLEARIGPQLYDSPAPGTADHIMDHREGNLVLSQLLFDGFNRRGEVKRQASRVDGASNRVYERSEFIALAIVREYLEIGRLFEVVSLNEQNVAYHRKVVGQLTQGAEQGALSAADKQLAQERVYAAEARLTQARQDLNTARIHFNQLVGLPPGPYTAAPTMGRFVPSGLDQAIGIARQNSPVVKIAQADLDAVYGQKMQAASGFYPKVSMEARARDGMDLEGIPGRLTDLTAELVVKWNIYRGGIDAANFQEQVRRMDEARFALDKANRDVEEAVRLAWDTRTQEQIRHGQLKQQLAATEQVVNAYTEQFKVGERTLLDLLDTVNTRINAQVDVVTSRYAVMFADYRVLAAGGTLLSSLQIPVPKQADAYARDFVRDPGSLEGETAKRRSVPFSPD